jgi:hypothetical protein
LSRPAAGTTQRSGWMYDRLMTLGMAHAHDIDAQFDIATI